MAALRGGIWHTWGPAAAHVARSRALGALLHHHLQLDGPHLARAQNGNLAADCYRWKPPLWWWTCRHRAHQDWRRNRTKWLRGPEQCMAPPKGPDWPRTAPKTAKLGTRECAHRDCAVTDARSPQTPPDAQRCSLVAPFSSPRSFALVAGVVSAGFPALCTGCAAWGFPISRRSEWKRRPDLVPWPCLLVSYRNGHGSRQTLKRKNKQKLEVKRREVKRCQALCCEDAEMAWSSVWGRHGAMR